MLITIWVSNLMFKVLKHYPSELCMCAVQFYLDINEILITISLNVHFSANIFN